MPQTGHRTSLHPKLIVEGADDAIDFYVTALGAALDERHTDESGTVVQALMTLRGNVFALAEAIPDWGWTAPPQQGSSPVLLTFTSDDPDEVARRMVAGGAAVVIPVEDRSWGRREGRLRDPFGHLWIIAGEQSGRER